MIKRLKKRFGKGERQRSDVEVEKRSGLRKSVETTMDAATFAEVGMHAEARQIMAEEQAAPRRVLVVGHEGTFSRPVIDYALGFAERMGYEIVALNVLDLPKDSEKVGPYCSLIAKEFENTCEQSVAEFLREAQERGIGFQHVVKVGDPDKCIKDVTHELRRIEFVISEPDALPEVAGKEEEVVIPVYAVASPA
ncbi:Universal stress protein family protein [Desulfacinum hydrothermale DSM 13146]|uniref:Universal stress protein family protein n=1 Tax=Desulfacinum hydrothermale DSM 13146 TaxID=1121390 RepID=A0A1W1XU35_9BACT|nr:universal stress protein [Desulfacinum hydrothermale]SMC27372.1 Universal stress protein family protein [Desulfacinum hydrothermale DSM 13146]